MKGEFKATVSDDGKQVIMTQDGWLHKVPIANLPAWVRFYRDLRDRVNGKYSKYYAAKVERLEKLESALKKRGQL